MRRDLVSYALCETRLELNMATLRTFDIPEGVEFRKEEDFLVAKGPKGDFKKLFKHPQIKVSVKDKIIEIKSDSDRRKTIAIVGTWEVLVKNMALGVTKGYEAEVKLIHSHFPARLELKDNKLLVSNFLGERRARVAKLPSGVDVKIDKNIIKITGPDKEIIGQTGTIIENATKIGGFDRRVFQDGCYVVKKSTLLS